MTDLTACAVRGARPIVPLDGRTKTARAVRRLIADLTASLGGTPSVAQQAAVRKAAELTVAAETARAALLRGDSVDLTGTVRLEGAADRALRVLGLPQKPVTTGPTLEAYAAAKRGAEAA